MKSSIFCNNCGKNGHLFHQCKNPITSIGVIAFNNDDKNNIKYLMIQRKDSLGFVDFMRGKYNLYNPNYIQNLIDLMTNKEKNNLLNKTFEDLWYNLWGDYVGHQYKNEAKFSKDKFNILKKGYYINNTHYCLQMFIKNSNTHWEYPEWGFAKGRRNYQENDLSCALREFQEETGYNYNNLLLIKNILPIEEIYTGSNYKSYKHKYYIGYLQMNNIANLNFQKTEVSKLEWLNLDKCINKIRPYNIEKINLIKNVNTILTSYSFYK